MEEEEEDLEGWGDDEEEFDAVDAIDSSWKVRRGAVHLIDAVIKANPEF